MFNDIDLDKDNCISYLELEELISSMKSGIIPYDPSTAAAKIMEELDVNADQLISEEEFVAGLSKWLNTIYKHKSAQTQNQDYQVIQINSTSIIIHQSLEINNSTWKTYPPLIMSFLQSRKHGSRQTS